MILLIQQQQLSQELQYRRYWKNYYNFTITTTNNENNCDETTVSGTVIIEPVDSLTLSSTIATTNQEICVGKSNSPIIYEFGGGANGANVTGLPPESSRRYLYSKKTS